MFLIGCSSSSPERIFGGNFAVIQPAYFETGERAVDLLDAWTPRPPQSFCDAKVCSRKFLPDHNFYVIPGTYLIHVFCRREPTNPTESNLIFTDFGPSIQVAAVKGKTYTIDCAPTGTGLNLSVLEGT
mgnify:CR=1 FL=1|tara:strand:- start:45 stop:428 length:384 start_codon:yes stop_codon:yes gene_type:complete